MKKITTLLALVFLANQATASLVANSTRIIYPSQAKETNIKITNKGERPYAAQVWITTNENEPESANKENTAPFFVSPSLSKIAANEGQTIRLIFTGDQLPTDRESIFYFNLLQIPSQEENSQIENRLQILIQDVFKVFYRPKEITGDSHKVKNEISFSLITENGTQAIKAKNPTAFYASFASASIKLEKDNISLTPSMIPPFSEEIWLIPKGVKDVKGYELNTDYVNDYGGYESISRKL